MNKIRSSISYCLPVLISLISIRCFFNSYFISNYWLKITVFCCFHCVLLERKPLFFMVFCEIFLDSASSSSRSFSFCFCAKCLINLISLFVFALFSLSYSLAAFMLFFDNLKIEKKDFLTFYFIIDPRIVVFISVSVTL
jgi:hypothetical protein